MFFKNISEWSKKKLRIWNLICGFLYLIMVLIIPIIIVCTRYRIFKETSATYKLTGFGIIFFIILGVYSYVKLKKMVAKLPQITLKQQQVKFSLDMLFSLIPYILLILAFWFTKDNVSIAYKTMLECVISLTAATLFEGIFYKYIQAEYEIRSKALEMNEIDKRRSRV